MNPFKNTEQTVLCCYTDLHPETERSVRAYAPTAKFVDTSGSNPNTMMGAFSHNNLNGDFWKFDDTLDNDIARMTGLLNAGGQNGAEFSAEVKIADAGSQVRQGEQADVVFDFL